MTDDNPLPNPRRSPDSDPPLPAWMTLPGSLIQPGAPSVEDTDAVSTSEPADAGPAEDVSSGPAASGSETGGAEPDVEDAAAGRGVQETATASAPEADAPGSASEDSAPLRPEDAAPRSGPWGVAPDSDPESAARGSGPEGSVRGLALGGAGSAGRGVVAFGAMSASEDAVAVEPGAAEGAAAAEAEAVVEGVADAAAGAGDEGAGEEAEGRSGEGPTLEAALEAILLVVDEPVAEVTLAQVLERPTHQVAAALRALASEYTAAGRGFDLREVAGGWRFYTRADCAQLVERFVRDGQQTRLTQAALETLAVVAYRQPVSRARVAAVRGVNSDGVMRTLVARGLVEEAGTDPESQAVLYRTSSYFLERLGLRDLSELPELAPFLPDDVENLEETTK